MIKLNQITTGYSRDRPLLKDYSYEFQNGKMYGVLGESGIGKTTLLKTIAGLIYPISGEIYIDDKILQKAEKNDVYMMHQNYTCFDWLNCLDNILIIEKIKHKKIDKETKNNALDILDKVGLIDSVKKYPKELSGGMRQRLALARMLYAKPKMILMDEPLSALDEITREKMQNLILETHEEIKNIIIMITHSTQEAEKMCDEILKL